MCMHNNNSRWLLLIIYCYYNCCCTQSVRISMACCKFRHKAKSNKPNQSPRTTYTAAMTRYGAVIIFSWAFISTRVCTFFVIFIVRCWYLTDFLALHLCIKYIFSLFCTRRLLARMHVCYTEFTFFSRAFSTLCGTSRHLYYRQLDWVLA